MTQSDKTNQKARKSTGKLPGSLLRKKRLEETLGNALLLYIYLYVYIYICRCWSRRSRASIYNSNSQAFFQRSGFLSKFKLVALRSLVLLLSGKFVSIKNQLTGFLLYTGGPTIHLLFREIGQCFKFQIWFEGELRPTKYCLHYFVYLFLFFNP